MEDVAIVDPTSVESESKLETKEDLVGDTCYPLDTFPVVWLKIYDKLDVEDKKTFSRASTQWHELAAPYSTEPHLPMVVNELVMRVPARNLNKCRQVSRLLKEELDNQRQNHVYNLHLQFERADGAERSIQDINVTNRFYSCQQIQKFMKEMGNHPSNPFPGKSVGLFCMNLDMDLEYDEQGWDRFYREFWVNAALLLEKFGHHVSYLSMGLDVEASFTIEKWQHLKNCLIHVPHLRKLTLYNGNCYVLPETMEYIRENPTLSQLSQLETLEFICFPMYLTILPDFENAILTSGLVPPSIKRIQRRNEEIAVLPRGLYAFHNLEVLETRLRIQELQRFGNLARPPSFKKLNLVVEDIGGATPTAEQIFNALEPFRDSLMHIKLMSRIVTSTPGETININFSKLEILELYWLNPDSFDFLVQLTSLKDFTIYYFRAGQHQNGHQVNFFGFESRMYESNIWKLIPSLQKLNVNGKIYTRSIYEKVVSERRWRCSIL